MRLRLFLFRPIGQTEREIAMMSFVCRLRAAVVALSMFAGLGGFAFAQTSSSSSDSSTSTSTASSSGMSFGAETGVVYVRGNGHSDLASEIDYTFDVMDSGADTSGNKNRLYLLGDDVVAVSTFGYNYYGAGVRFDPSKSLAAALKKTNIPVDSFKVYVDATAGNAIPSSGSSLVSFHVGIGAKVALTSSGSVSWDLAQAKLFRVGSKNYATISTNVSAHWGSN